MKQKSLLKTMLLLCALVVGSVSVWADIVTFTAGTDTSEGTSITKNGITVSFSSGVFNRDDNYRCYSGASMTISSTVGNITQIDFTATSSNPMTKFTGNPDVGSWTDNTKTQWTGDASEINFGTTSGQCRITEIVVTYTASGGGDTPTIYTVTYDGNGATSGNVPTDDTEYDADNNIVTVLGNIGNLAKEHYTFTGWNTVAAGTGTSYVAGNTFTISANTTLYAQWAGNTNTVTLPETDQFGTYAMSATNPVAYNTEVTLTYTPAEGYEDYQATWSMNGEEIAANKFIMPDEAVTITVSVNKVLAMTIDFESDATAYSDWTFTNIESNYKNTEVDTHGGLKYGHTAGKTSGSIQTKEKVNPASLTCYVSKQTNNSSEAIWYVQVSSDGSSWTEVGSRSASDMAKGEWKEFTVDLSKHSDVYVRVYFWGTTAIRLIDDLTLVLQDSDTPFISADNVELEYDATTGFISYTINNVEGGTLTAATTANWLTLGTVGETVPFTCSANTEAAERTATVTLTYTYGDNETLTKEVTVTQAAAPVIYATIPALFTAATSTATGVLVTFDNWVVSGVSTNGKNVFVTDGTNGFVINSSTDQSSTYNVGDVLSGTAVSCSLKLNTGYAQITNLDANDLIISTGGTVSAANIAMANLAGLNTGALVSYENLTCTVSTSGNNTFYDLSDGTTTIRAYTSLYNYTTTPDLENGKTYNITGIYQQYNNTKEILPRSAADIEEVVSTEPSITVDPDLVEVNADEHDGTLDLTYENLTITSMEDFDIQYYDAEGEEAGEPDWIEVLVAEQDPQIGEGYVVSYYMLENDGEARTAYFKVWAGTSPVYSNLVTITQAAPVAPPTGDQYELFTGDELVEGDYVICYNNSTWTAAMKNEVVSNRLSYGEVNPENDVITTNDATIVWHIAKSGDYWTIYSADAEAYAAGTGTKNQAQMLADGTDDKALWTVSGSSTYEFVNKKNAANNVNANLRNNGTYGFACYATSTGGALSLYKKVEEEVILTANLNSDGYGTFSATVPVDFSDATDFTAWVITGISGTNITFEQVTGAVPAETGVLLKGSASTTVNPNVATTGTAPTTNLLVAITSATEIGNGEYYGLSGKTFVPVNAGIVPAGKALLPASDVPSGARLTFVFEDATGIATIEHSSLNNNSYYNLSGQRVDSPKKGMYIVNGKKVVVK